MYDQDQDHGTGQPWGIDLPAGLKDLSGEALRDTLASLSSKELLATGLRGKALLTALETAGRTFAYPAEVASVWGKDTKTIYDALMRHEIPYTRIGQRFHISVAWLRRQVDGLDTPQPAGSAA